MPAIDRVNNDSARAITPWTDGIKVTPSDAAELPVVSRLIRIGAAGGTLRIKTMDGSDLSIPVSAGDELCGRIRQVYATGTTVGDIWCFW